jgi:integrase
MDNLPDGYQRVVTTLSKQYFDYLGGGTTQEEIDCVKMAEWLVNIKMPNVKGTSWNLYKCSIKAYFKFIDSPNSKDAIFILNSASLGYRRENTPSRKVKSGSDSRLSLLSKELQNPKRKYGSLTLLWFKTCLLTGARPNEIWDAEFKSISGIEHLRIKNSKVVEMDSSRLRKDQAGRTRFHYRSVPLNHLFPEDLHFIKRFLTSSKLLAEALDAEPIIGKPSGREQVYDACRATIYSASRVSTPLEQKKISLGTARHIFRDNTKRDLEDQGVKGKLLDVYLAILLGHGSTDTNYAYGTDSGALTSKKINIEMLGKEKEMFLRRVLTRYD